MKLIYILIVLAVAASLSGCAEKEQAGIVTPTPVQTTSAPGEVSPGEVSPGEVTPGEVSSGEVSPGEAPSDDIFGTESNLSALDTSFDDMNMEISLVDI